MAKENKVVLIGELYGKPEIKRDKGRVEFILRTIRRTDRHDFPVIHVYEENQFDKIASFEKGDYIYLTGSITTVHVNKKIECPFCGKEEMVKGTSTIVTAIDPVKLGRDFSLEQFKEGSNLVSLLGSLTGDPRYDLLPGSETPSCHYQLAVGRKYRVNKKREDDKTTDFPWVNSFGEQALSDNKRLRKSSQVYIAGAIQTRKITKPFNCSNPACSQGYAIEDAVAEIVPYFVEYLDNCKF